jgi:hypothetical protein
MIRSSFLSFFLPSFHLFAPPNLPPHHTALYPLYFVHGFKEVCLIACLDTENGGGTPLPFPFPLSFSPPFHSPSAHFSSIPSCRLWTSPIRVIFYRCYHQRSISHFKHYHRHHPLNTAAGICHSSTMYRRATFPSPTIIGIAWQQLPPSTHPLVPHLRLKRYECLEGCVSACWYMSECYVCVCACVCVRK